MKYALFLALVAIVVFAGCQSTTPDTTAGDDTVDVNTAPAADVIDVGTQDEQVQDLDIAFDPSEYDY